MIYFKLVLVALIWAGTFIGTRIAAQVFGPFTGASFRYAFAILFMIPIALFQDKNTFRLSKKQFLQVALLGLTGIFGYSFFFFKGMKLVPASHGALLVSLNPVFVMILSSIRYKERVRPIRLLGAILSIIGVVIIISRGNIAGLISSFQWGDAFMLGCPVVWALYTFFASDALKEMKPFKAATWATITGWIMLMCFVPTEQFPLHVSSGIWLALIYLGLFGTVIAAVWYYEGISKIGPLRTAVFNNLIPVFALILSVLLLHEKLEPHTLYGSVFVVLGILLTNKF